MKEQERNQAVALRKTGATYNEILKKVPVAKSTLSLWLREVSLAKRQKQRLTAKRRAAQLRGGAVRHEQRLRITESIHGSAIAEVSRLTKRELLLIGAVMYWAEGTKEKSYGNAGGVDFSNTDPLMITFFIRWLTYCCEVPSSAIYANLYIHEFQRQRTAQALEFWVHGSSLRREQIRKIYFKKHNPKSRRHNFSENYYGTLRVRVIRSSGLMRKIAGWVKGIAAHDWGVV